jgi:hypothetical protein
LLELEPRHHPLGGEQLHDVSVSARHDEFVGSLAEDETDEAIVAVRSPSTHTVTAADGKFNLVAH